MSYFPPREKVIRSLKNLAGRTCGYALKGSLPSVCDCKFGVEKLRKSEHSGCPELRLMIMMLEEMTDKEYHERVTSRDA